MKRVIRILLLVVVGVLALGALTIGGSYLYRWATRPSLEKHGGTILVYEIDVDRFPDEKLPDTFSMEEMLASIKRRLDPSEWDGIIVEAADKNRIKIGVPRTGNHDERVKTVKELIAIVGHLEFRILANKTDDGEGINSALLTLSPMVKFFAKNEPELLRRAQKGLPPLSPNIGPATDYPWKTPFAEGRAAYQWVAVSQPGLNSFQLYGRDPAHPDVEQPYDLARGSLGTGEPVVLESQGQIFLYCRPGFNESRARANRAECFLLTREPPTPSEAVTGKYLTNVYPTEEAGKPAIGFRLNDRGAELLRQLTTDNQPNKGNSPFRRRLAIILDDQIESAPSINGPVGANGVITGYLTSAQVARFVDVLRAGALPASLKRQPLSETSAEAK